MTSKRKNGSSSHSTSSMESVDEIIQNPLFCNTKDDDIYYCDGDLDLNGAKISSQTPTVDPISKYIYGQKTTVPNYATSYTASSQNMRPWQDHTYFSQTP